MTSRDTAIAPAQWKAKVAAGECSSAPSRNPPRTPTMAPADCASRNSPANALHLSVLASKYNRGCNSPLRPPSASPAIPLKKAFSQILIHFSEIKITIRYLSRKYRSAANKRTALHAPGKEKGISFRNESRGFHAPEPCCAAETFGPANGILRPRAIKNRPVSERILPGFCGAFLV